MKYILIGMLILAMGCHDHKNDNLLVGVYADLGLDYKGIVSLNLTGRNDWSSTFSQQQRSYSYPGVAAAVNLTEAISAWRSNKVLNFAKLFANYAKVGKDADVVLWSDNPLSIYAKSLYTIVNIIQKLCKLYILVDTRINLLI